MNFHECFAVAAPVLRKKVENLITGPALSMCLQKLDELSVPSSTEDLRHYRPLQRALEAMSLRSVLNVLHRTSVSDAAWCKMEEFLKCVRQAAVDDNGSARGREIL